MESNGGSASKAHRHPGHGGAAAGPHEPAGRDHYARELRGSSGEPAISPAVVTWHAANIFAKLYVAPRDPAVARVEERRGAAGDGGP